MKTTLLFILMSTGVLTESTFRIQPTETKSIFKSKTY